MTGHSPTPSYEKILSIIGRVATENDSLRDELQKLKERYKARSKAERMIPTLCLAAREVGYALAVHGSLERDIDLIAVPWAEDAIEPAQLAEIIRKCAEAISGAAFIAPHEQNEFPRKKEHGRLCWAFHLGGGPYIDLSIMPRDRKNG